MTILSTVYETTLSIIFPLPSLFGPFFHLAPPPCLQPLPEVLLHPKSSFGQHWFPTLGRALLNVWLTGATKEMPAAALVDVAGGHQGLKTHRTARSLPLLPFLLCHQFLFLSYVILFHFCHSTNCFFQHNFYLSFISLNKFSNAFLMRGIQLF